MLRNIKHEGGVNNGRDADNARARRRRVHYPRSRPLLTRPSTLYRVTYCQVCFKCFNSHRVHFANDGSCARQLALHPSVLMHGKVSITRFNAPAGDTFQAISLAGGHVISIKYTL